MLLKNEEDVRELMSRSATIDEKINWELDKQEDSGKEPDFMQAARDSKQANPVIFSTIEIIDKDIEVVKDSDRFWNSNDIEMVQLSSGWYALDGWNGETYADCYRYTDSKGLERADAFTYELVPQQKATMFDDNNEPYEWETIGYVICRI